MVPTLLMGLQVEKKFDILVAASQKLAVGKKFTIPDCSNMLFTSVAAGKASVLGKCSPSKSVVNAKKWLASTTLLKSKNSVVLPIFLKFWQPLNIN